MSATKNVLEIITQGSVPTTGGQTKQFWNVFHYRLLGGAALAGIDAIVTQFLAQCWTNGVALCISTGYTGVTTLYRILDDANVQYTSGAAPANGQVVGQRLPTSSAVRVNYRCYQRGKFYRGAKFFGPIPETHVAGDDLNSTALPLWNTALAQLKSTVSAGGVLYTPVVLSRVLSAYSLNPTTLDSSDVSQLLLNKTIASFRRRKEKTVR